MNSVSLSELEIGDRFFIEGDRRIMEVVRKRVFSAFDEIAEVKYVIDSSFTCLDITVKVNVIHKS